MLGVFAASGPARAADTPQWLLQTSLYTIHFQDNPEHNNHQRLASIEYQRADQWLMGGSAFDNSYGQPTQYVYVGKLFRPLDAAPLVHFKLTGGLIHGYKDQYKDKIPLNSRGVAPAIIPAVGLSGRRLSGEVNFFGLAGLMVTMGVLF
jgi:hypothetical protein